jgi:dolichol-phosphate mannosyltransferase
MSIYLICIPTYNEAENIVGIIERTLATNIKGLSILVVDDGSPDGTARLVEEIAEKLADPRIHLLRRNSKSGLGPAYLAAFDWALQRSYDYVIEMDADGSHQPEELSRLIEASHNADLVLGTRWMPGGRVENWPIYRRAISRIGTWYAEIALKVPYKDLTGGYRVLSRNLLESIDLRSIQTLGYGFQIEIAMRAFDAGLRVVQVPITFIERTQGRSKMSRRIVFEALERTTIWGFQRRFNRR